MIWVVLAALLILPSPRPHRRLAQEKPALRPKIPRDGPEPFLIAMELDMLAACLDAGMPQAHAVNAVASIARPATTTIWAHIGALLQLGIPAQRAWADAEGVVGLSDIARIARRADATGAASAPAIRRIAQSLRTEATNHTKARAERAGVLIALPLTFCFLPAFFVLGLAPVILSLAGDMLTLN